MESNPQFDANGIPRHRTIEVEITSTCDLRCPSCDRFIDVAPAPSMTLNQILDFVVESIALHWRWARIHILGGEPTLHPQLRDIVELFLSYRAFHPAVKLTLISNGRGQLKEHRAWLEDRGIKVAVEAKSGGPPLWFHNMRCAPLDIFPELSRETLGRPCGNYGIVGCGLGLTRHGYFLCGAGASIARVIGADIGFLHLADISHAGMLEQAKTLCPPCGHWTDATHGRRYLCDVPQTSPFWDAALAAYAKAVPPMSLYGKAR